jgi:fatty acid desaturase
VITGSWFRSRSRSAGDWMIVVGILPFLALFWLIVPPVLAIVVMAMALMDSARKTEPGVQSACPLPLRAFCSPERLPGCPRRPPPSGASTA